MKNLKRYMIIAAITLFVIGWIATGSIAALLTTTIGYVLNYGLQAVCIAAPILILVWLLYKIIKP